MRYVAFIVALAMVCGVCAKRQKSTRPGLKLKPPVEKPATQVDTIWVSAADFEIAGYEKAQNSSVESMFVTNHTLHRVKTINFTIEYVNVDGQQLHQATHSINCDIPVDERRSVQFKSWDKQHLWYYYLSQAKHNDYSTPFDVKVKVNYIVIK